MSDGPRIIIPRHTVRTAKTVKDMWEEHFARFTKRMHTAERQERRRTFYEGAYAMYEAMTQVGECFVDPDQGHAYLEGLRIECEAYLLSRKPITRKKPNRPNRRGRER